MAKHINNTSNNSKDEEKFYCDYCGRKEKVYRMFDIDGTNLVEKLVCLNCGSGTPSIL